MDPKKYNLNSRTKLEQISPDEIAIVKIVKSRIIMKDGQKILEMADKIKAVDPAVKVYLKCTTNICSKTRAFLDAEGILVINE